MLVLAGSSQAPLLALLLVTSKLFSLFVSQPTYKNTEAVYWSEGLFRGRVAPPSVSGFGFFLFFLGGLPFSSLFGFLKVCSSLFSTSLLSIVLSRKVDCDVG